MDRIKIVTSVFIATVLIIYSAVSFSGGIRWFHRLNFKAPPDVSATVTKVSYVGASGNGKVGELILKGQYASVIDNYPVLFNAGRLITSGTVAGLTLNVVKLMGPALVASLGILYWDSLLNMWMKSSEISENGTDWPSCQNTPLNVIKYRGVRACVRTCSAPHGCAGGANLAAPWQVSNNIYDSKCSPCALGGAWSTEWRSQEYVPVYPPGIPATDSEILDALTNYLNASPSNFIDFVNRVDTKTDLGPAILAASSPWSLDGPGNFSKTSTSTSTAPGGQTSIATTTTYNMSYAPSTTTTTITQTTTNVTTNPDNTTSTTTTTKTGEADPNSTNPTPPTPDEQPPQEKPPVSDLCKDHPDILACIALGEAEDRTIPDRDGPANFSKEMSASGTCPPDITINMFGSAYAVSWSPLCTFADKIRPVLLALCWISAGIFVFRTISNSD